MVYEGKGESPVIPRTDTDFFQGTKQQGVKQAGVPGTVQVDANMAALIKRQQQLAQQQKLQAVATSGQQGAQVHQVQQGQVRNVSQVQLCI